MASVNPTRVDSGLRLVEARIRNFRSLRAVDIRFDELTVLIGENNSGKTSLLEALYAAIGAGRRVLTSDDLFLGIGEAKVPRERTIVIDLLFRPADPSGTLDEFPVGSYWLELWGTGISQDADDNDFMAIRTKMAWNTGKAEYETKRQFLAEWSSAADLDAANTVPGAVATAQLEPIALYLLDAKRDIQDELQSRSSFWHKLVSDPGLPEKTVAKIERILSKLNASIVDGSPVLSHVQTHLDDLYKTVSSGRGAVSVTPLARHLRDLSRGMDIGFSTKGAQTFPLVRHGMGTRSLAAVLTFRAYSQWRQMRDSGGAVHSLLALEEPEAHLHPQAQRALFAQIEAIPGQRFISTHSPYIAAQAEIGQFRHFRKEGAETTVSQMSLSGLSPEDLRKIDRMVLNTRGELLFARALVFFEGETEEQALPFFAKAYWGEHIHTMGISMIGVGGQAYLPFVRLAESFDIPWFIFSDGEPQTIASLLTMLRNLGRPSDLSDSANDNVLVIPGGKDLEAYLIQPVYEAVLVEMIIKENSRKPQHEAALRHQWANESNKLAKIEQELSANKTRYALPLALAITSMTDPTSRFPTLIRELLETMSLRLGLTQAT